jgi:hypothetical protein
MPVLNLLGTTGAIPRLYCAKYMSHKRFMNKNNSRESVGFSKNRIHPSYELVEIELKPCLFGPQKLLDLDQKITPTNFAAIFNQLF